MFERVDYAKLNNRQQENYNYFKVASSLADCGYTSIRLTDDYGGADFLAISINGDVLKIQLKTRFLFARKYVGKGLYIAFRSGTDVFIYPHDELLPLALPYIENSVSWAEGRQEYFWPKTPEWARAALVPYRLP
jgi:hypothetical protein